MEHVNNTGHPYRYRTTTGRHHYTGRDNYRQDTGANYVYQGEYESQYSQRGVYEGGQPSLPYQQTNFQTHGGDQGQYVSGGQYGTLGPPSQSTRRESTSTPSSKVVQSIPVPEVFQVKVEGKEEDQKKYLGGDDLVKFDVLMGKINNLGFQGKSFIDFVMERLKELTIRLTGRMDTIESRLSTLEGQVSNIRENVVLRNEFESAMQVLDGASRRVAEVSNRVGQLNNRVNTLSFNQNSRIARSLKFRYECCVKLMIETEFDKRVNFRPLEVRLETEHFREPKECSKYLSEHFKGMRDFMNTVSSHRSPLDNRKDKFLRIPGDKIAFPSISIDDNGGIVIFRMTTSPLACLFDKNYKELRHMYTFVKNLFYNMSVLEYQVSSIKDQDKVILVSFVYETLQYSSSSLCDFIKFYPLEFQNLNHLFSTNRMVFLSMKDLDTKRLTLREEISRNINEKNDGLSTIDGVQ